MRKRGKYIKGLENCSRKKIDNRMQIIKRKNNKEKNKYNKRTK